MKSFFLSIFIFLGMINAHAQKTQLSGTVSSEKGNLVATISLSGTQLATTSDDNGRFTIEDVPAGNYTLIVESVGHMTNKQPISFTQGEQKDIRVNLSTDRLNLNEVVVSGTRYDIKRKESPVIVGVIGSKLFNATQSVAMSESLNYQPGLRIENNCQNCGFNQVRMNGLEGAYSQILMNSRPIFSALNGVYGLDQIPTSMIDRIEVVRGGGSALYGSSAIAGTINVITKDPVTNSWEIMNNTGLIDGKKLDNTLSFNASVVSEDLSNGVTFYGSRRSRQAYDANGDGFTELVKLESNTFGSKAFYKFSDQNKLTFDFSAIKEFRRGGDQLDLAPHFTNITEMLDHNTLMGGLTYDQYSKDFRTKYSVYASAQHTNRDSYYGGLGGEDDEEAIEMAANAYGNTKDMAFVGGGQITHTLNNEDVFTGGLEYNFSRVDDGIAGYNRSIDQRVNSTGLYAQYEWKLNHHFKALVGGRFDHISVDGDYTLGSVQRSSDASVSAFSPRLTFLYDVGHSNNLQLRAGYARGFRAPQAFDEDMHVSSIEGDQQFVIIGDDLDTEYSNAYTVSFDYNKIFGTTQTSFLLEGFYTDLRNPFTYVSLGEIENNIRLEQMVNGQGAYVTGANFEIGIAPSDRLSFQLGGTVQTARYREEQELFEDEDPDGDPSVFTKQLVRTPDGYGYFNSSWKPTRDFSVDLTSVYTGSMIAPRVVRESGFLDLVQTPEFFELNLKLSHVFRMRSAFAFELSGGVQNIFNSFQRDFDTGPERDADYVYGPYRPRTFFLGLKIGSF